MKRSKAHWWIGAVTAAVTAGACSQSPAGSVVATRSPSASASAAATLSVTPSVAPTPTARPTVAIVTVTPIPDAPDSGIVLGLVAKNSRWIPNELTAPAGKIWHVALDNQDGIDGVHNFVVASGRTFAERIFTSDRVPGGSTVTIDVPGLPAGAYLFICTIHPNQMTSELTLN